MYRYEALPSQGHHIRILVLEPGGDDAPLLGRLETVELRSAADLLPFKAISYVWGSGNKDQIIFVNKKCLEITRSLRDSLRQARDAHRAVALWADGICINQDDEEEKSRQVALMGRIYETSRCTLICLGLGLGTEDRQHATAAAGLIAEVEALIQEVFEHPKFSWDWDSFPYPPADHVLLRDYRWDSWGRLVQQPWFHRGWVVQEAALGPDAFMLWAGEEVRLVGMLRVYAWLSARAQSLMPTVTFRTIPVIHLDLYHIQHPEEVRTFWPQEHQYEIEAPRPALEILHYSRRLLLSDPKDRIYAFMALRTLDKAMPAVRPNYGKDVTHLDVYRDFAIKYLEQTSDLDILCFVGHKDENSLSSVAVADARVPCIPSWVPRWDCGPISSAKVDRAVRKFACIEGEPNNSRGSPISILEGRPVLRVRAIVFGSVIYVSEPITDDFDAPEKAVAQVFSLWRNLVPQSEKYPGPHCGVSGLAFLTVLLFGLFIRDFQDFLQSLLDLARRLQPDQPFHPAVVYIHDPAVLRISLLAADQSRNTRLILIDRGYYARALNTTREGDVCTIIHGTRTPFILRRVPGKQDQYKVVGPVLVLSKEINKETGLPCRLGQDESCYDWKEWDVQSEDIVLV